MQRLRLEPRGILKHASYSIEIYNCFNGSLINALHSASASLPSQKNRKPTLKELADEYNASSSQPIHLPSRDLYAISENEETFRKIKSRKNWRKIRHRASISEREGGVGMGDGDGSGGEGSAAKISSGGAPKSSEQSSFSGRSITTLESFVNS